MLRIAQGEFFRKKGVYWHRPARSVLTFGPSASFRRTTQSLGHALLKKYYRDNKKQPNQQKHGTAFGWLRRPIVHLSLILPRWWTHVKPP
jgi:hypothetical protein